MAFVLYGSHITGRREISYMIYPVFLRLYLFFMASHVSVEIEAVGWLEGLERVCDSCRETARGARKAPRRDR